MPRHIASIALSVKVLDVQRLPLTGYDGFEHHGDLPGHAGFPVTRTFIAEQNSIAGKEASPSR
jgi:hypothetical protein